MEENNQQQQRERFQRRFSEQQEQQVNWGNVATFTALGAAGIVYGGRSGGFNRLGRLISEEGVSAYRAAKEVMDNADPIRRLDSESYRQRMKDIKKEYEGRGQEFKKTYKRNLRERKDAGSQEKLLLNRDRDVSAWMRNLNDILGNSKGTIREQDGRIKKAYEDQFRHRRIVEKIQQSSNEAVKANIPHMTAIVNEMSPFMLGKEGNEALLRKHFKKRNFTNQSALDEFQKIQADINRELKEKSSDSIAEFEKSTKQKIEKEAIDQIVATESIRKDAVAKASSKIMGHKQLTVGDVMRLSKQKKVEVDKDTLENMQRAIHLNQKFENVVYDRHMYIKGDHIQDYNIFKEVKHGFMDWYADSLPGGLFQLRTRIEIEKARRNNAFHVFERGTRQSVLAGHLGGESPDILGEHLINLKGKVFQLTDQSHYTNPDVGLQAINKEGRIHLMSAEYGPVGKMMRRMSGIQTPYKERNAVTEFLDLGNQDKDNTLRSLVSRFTKFGDDKWDRNWVKRISKGGVNSPDDVYKLQAYLSLNTLGMTPRAFKSIAPETKEIFEKIGRDVSDFNVSDSVQRVELFKDIGRTLEAADPNTIRGAESALLNKYLKYANNPEKFLLRSTPISHPDLVLGTATRMRTGMDEIDQVLSSYVLDSVVQKRSLQSGISGYYEQAEGLRQGFRALQDQGFLTKVDLQHAEESLNYSIFTKKFHESSKDDSALMANINQMIANTPEMGNSLQKMSQRTTSALESYGFEPMENRIGDKFVAINEAKGVNTFFSAFRTDPHMSLGERFKVASSPITQMLAGRKNMEDVTTATMSGYYMAHRLEQMISGMGLGFSDNSMGSTISVMTNLMVKRLLPPVLGYEAFQYGDYMWDSLTGQGFTERYENMKADQMLDKVANMTVQEKYEQQKARQLKPGLEHLNDMPAFSLPIAGRINPLGTATQLVGNAFSLNTSFVDLDERTDMTYDDALEDLYFGVEAQRKGKWWLIGSTTAYRGGRVDYFKPNSFRMAHSDWEDAGVGLTRKEYWSHHWLPTLQNPLGGLSYIAGLKDPYYFEKKHYEDRPFMLTGELFNPNTMLLGDIGNMTIGRMVKPVKEMHEDYWSEPFLQTAGQSPIGETPPPPVYHAYKLSPGNGLTEEGTSYAGLPEPPTYTPPPKYGPRKLEERLDEAALLGPAEFSEDPKKDINSANLIKRAIVRSNKLDEEGNETGDFIIRDVMKGKSIYVPTRVDMDKKTTYDDLVNEAYEVEPEKFLSSGRLGVAIKGINDIMAINSPMSGLFSTAPMEMIMGNSYLEMQNHRDAMRTVYADDAMAQQVSDQTQQVAQQVGGIPDATEYSPRAREAVAMGLIDPNQQAPLSGWTDTSTQPAMRQEMDVIDPRSAAWKKQEMIENWTEPLGVYKWMFSDEMLGYNPYQGKAVIQQADYAYSMSAKFWQSNIGSLGGGFSEFARRFMRPYDGQVEYFNPIRNTMPEWMPGNSYMIDFKTGDPYSKIDGGEYRLPGGAYERLNELHSDHFGKYGAFDRFKILADVAPWSDEYNMWSDYVQEYVVDEKLRKQAEGIRKQAAARKTKYEFTENRFNDNEVTWVDAKISTFVDDYRFMIQGSDDIYTLAGVSTRPKAEGVMKQYFKEGDVVRVGVAKDENRRGKQDTNNTIGAVVKTALGNVNQDIIQRGLMKESMNDFSAAGVQARFSDKEIREGKRWETIAHYPSVFNTKLMPVRTALEEYERDQVYGKDWATWENFLFSDYIKPFYEGLGRYTGFHAGAAGAVGAFGMNMGAAALGSWVVGKAFLPQGGRKPLILGTMAVAGVKQIWNGIKIGTSGRADIPERRIKEAEINEYYDVLKYMKYEGMYQKAREEILHRSGVDVEKVFNEIETMQATLKEKQKGLEKERKTLWRTQQEEEKVMDPTLQKTMNYDFEKGELVKIEPTDKPFWKRKRKELNRELTEMKERLPRIIMSPDIQQALEYRQQRDQTIYNLDFKQSRADLAKAFSHKDRYFFDAFSNATDKEKARLRQILPEYQLGAYERIWANDKEAKAEDYRKPLEYYEKKYGLPDWRWAGWRPEVNIDDIKMKTVAAEGMDLTDFGFWEADLDKASYAPSLGSDDSNALQSTKTFAGYTKFKQSMQSILEGAGLWDVNVTVVPVDKKMTNVTVMYEQNRVMEVEAGIKKEMYNEY